jgi:hypothetical protein
MITIRQLRLPGIDKPVAELAAYFGTKSRLPDQALVVLTADARTADSRQEATAAACGIHSYEDRRGRLGYWRGRRGPAVLRHPARG